jgi:hypothetical protein
MGIVVLVGSAARLVTSDIPIAAITHGQNTKLFPDNMMNPNVSGVMIQPCMKIITANQTKRLFPGYRTSQQKR